MHTIGFDIGGSSVRAAVVSGDGRILDSYRTDTPRTQVELDGVVRRIVADLRRAHAVAAIGLGVAGFISKDCSRVMYAPHLPWRDAPVAAQLAADTGLPVRLDHDVNGAAWAEFRRGAAQDAEVALVVALGTGVGCGLIVAGEIFRGGHGVAPELGHVIVVPGGRPCACGKSGCFERYCSGTALVETAIEKFGGAVGPASTAAGASVVRSSVGMTSGPGRWRTGRDVAAAALAGDRRARDTFDDLGRWLGRGAAIAADLLDPDVIVISGGVSESASLFLDGARAAFTADVTGGAARPVPQLTVGRFGSDAGVIGAALLAAGADGV